MMIYIAVDGDNIGQQVGRASLQDDEPGLRKISLSIETGQEQIKTWVEIYGGSLITAGGDEARATIPDEILYKIEELRQKYAAATGFTLSAGLGKSLSQADKALTYAKLHGKNQTILYDAEVEHFLQSIVPQKEQDKLLEEYYKSTYCQQFKFDKSNPIKPSKNLLAIEMDNGDIFFHPKTSLHIDTIAELDLPLDRVKDGGFITPAGEYISGSSDFSNKPMTKAQPPVQAPESALQLRQKLFDIATRQERDAYSGVQQIVDSIQQQIPAIESLKQTNQEAYVKAVQIMAGIKALITNMKAENEEQQQGESHSPKKPAEDPNKRNIQPEGTIKNGYIKKWDPEFQRFIWRSLKGRKLEQPGAQAADEGGADDAAPDSGAQ